MNGYVRTGWPRVESFGGMPLLDAWYDRPYEYAWAGAALDRIRADLARPLRVLDVGPGPHQPLVDELVLRGYEVAAVDSDYRAVAAVRQRLGEKVAIWQENARQTTVGLYDVVSCVSAIEHDPDWRDLAANLARARRLLLTFGVYLPEAEDEAIRQEMFVPVGGPEEVVSILETCGLYVGGIDFSIPKDALIARGLLTFVVEGAR